MKTQKVKLGDVCSFYRGASVPRARMYSEGDYLYIHYGDLYKGFENKVDVENPAKPIPFILANENIKTDQFLHDQDIIYVLTSETVDDLGHAYLFNNPQNLKAVSGTETTILRVDRRDILLPEYLNYLMKSRRFLSELRQYTRGMKVFRVHPNDVARIEIDLPPLSTQTKIAHVLSTLDAKIAVNNRLMLNLSHVIEALFHELYINSPIDELRTISTRLKTKVKELSVPVFSAVKTGELVMSQDYFNKQVYSKSISNYILVPPLAVAYNPARANIGSLGLNKFGFQGCVSPVYVVFAPAEGYEYYLDELMKAPTFRKEVAVRSSGSVRQSFSFEDFQQIRLPIPTLKDALTFNEKTVQFRNGIKLAEQENKKLAALRDTLLPKLMSGEVETDQKADAIYDEMMLASKTTNSQALKEAPGSGSFFN